MAERKKQVLVNRLISLTQKVVKAQEARDNFLRENVYALLREIDEERQEHSRESQAYLEKVGVETGLFTTSRHARRCLFVIKAVELKYLTEAELAEAMAEGVSLSAIGQLLEGSPPPKRGEFRRWLVQLRQRGMATRIRKARGK